jgi:hypothetical protein
MLEYLMLMLHAEVLSKLRTVIAVQRYSPCILDLVSFQFREGRASCMNNNYLTTKIEIV